MTNEVAIYSANVQVANMQRAVQIQKAMIRNTDTNTLQDFLVAQVDLGFTWRGISNKKEEEVKAIAVTIGSILKEKYPYLTIDYIANCWRQYNYGRDFNNTVCPDALLMCLEKADAGREQFRNKDFVEHTKVIQIKPISEMSKEEKLGIIYNGFKYWKEYGCVDDIRSEIWKCLVSFAPNMKYKTTTEQRRKYLSKARKETNEYFYSVTPYRYKNIRELSTDINLLRTNRYKNFIVARFREYWLRDFFAKSKWNKEYNDNQKQQ